MNRQLKLLQVPHSSFYYKSQREISRTASDEQVKDEMLEIYMETPFYGVPRLTAELKRRGYKVNHKRVRRLQKCLNLRTVYPRPHFNTSEPHPEHVKFLDHFFIFQKNSLHLKLANFSSLKRRSIFTSRKILREKLELHSTSKKSLNIAKMVEKRFELPTSTHDLSYEKIRLADCHKIPIFSDKSENPHARVTGVHKFLTFTPPSVPVDNREASHQEMKPL